MEEKKINNVEAKEKTGIWAWKHPHHNGEIEYVEVKGNIELENVDFSLKIPIVNLCITI